MHVEKLRGLGWRPSISLRDGIAATYEWFKLEVAADAA
jgi:GDP-L-fucose synthase